MQPKSQFRTRIVLAAVLVVSAIPCGVKAGVLIWGIRHGYIGKALGDGLDFWAGGFLALHHHVDMVFDPVAYRGFLNGIYGLPGMPLPTHMWSYPPNYLLLVTTFDWLSPAQAVMAFDIFSLAVLVWVLRLARQPWGLIIAVVVSPVALENIFESQNSALMTALIGGGFLVLPYRPRLGGVLVGLASIKPQLGITLPLALFRRSPVAVAYAALAALGLAVASLYAFGAGAWVAFWEVTRPAMSNVLLLGMPKEFAGGLMSVFATSRPLGVHAALLIQGAVTLGAIAIAARRPEPAVVLILAALGSPYLHNYDLLGVALAVALLVRDRIANGFAPGEAVLFFVVWFGPGALPWVPQYAHFTPLVLALLLATALRRGPVTPCDSSQVRPGSPGLLDGRLPIPDPPDCTAPGLSVTE
jgi:hypothetical protein